MWRGGAVLVLSLTLLPIVQATGTAQPTEPAPPAVAAAESPARSTAGLIVKLREAPPHRGSGSPAGRKRGEAHAARVRQVMSEAGLDPAALRPTGRAAHLLDFGGPLTGQRAQRLAERLRERPEVEWVVANERERPLQVPGDPFFAASAMSTGQWWLRPVSGTSANVLKDRLRGVPGLQSAWVTSTGHPDAVVAVLDTGITHHPDLDAHVLPGHDFVSEIAHANDGDGRDADPSDPGDWVSQADKSGQPALFGDCDVVPSSWHGTVIAGILAAVTDNGQGVAGVSWNGRVLPVRVAGKCGAEVADIVDGMRWAAGLEVSGVPINPNPARVINISFGGGAPCNAAYQDAIDELRDVGAVVVAAAGNGQGAVKRPASCVGVIGVAALNRDGFKANYSSFGPEVVVSTVGGDPVSEGVWGALLGDDGLLTLDNLGLRGPEQAVYGNAFGTSFAAPVVAGTVGLMLSVNPALSGRQLIEGVRRSARPHATSSQMAGCSTSNPGRCTCTTLTCGAGILDAPQALLYASAPASYVPPNRQAAVLDSRETEAAAALGADQAAATGTPVADAAAGGGGAPGFSWLLLLTTGLALLFRDAALRRRSGMALVSG